jgi:hypothetical protein
MKPLKSMDTLRFTIPSNKTIGNCPGFATVPESLDQNIILNLRLVLIFSA